MIHGALQRQVGDHDRRIHMPPVARLPRWPKRRLCERNDRQSIQRDFGITRQVLQRLLYQLPVGLIQATGSRTEVLNTLLPTTAIRACGDGVSRQSPASTLT